MTPKGPATGPTPPKRPAGVESARAPSPAEPSGVPDVASHTVPPTARGQGAQEALLGAGGTVFGECGYHSATIVAITQRANVALGT